MKIVKVSKIDPEKHSVPWKRNTFYSIYASGRYPEIFIKIGRNLFVDLDKIHELLEKKTERPDVIRITVPGPPIPKARPRFSRHKKNVVTYDSQKKVMGTMALLVKDQYKKKIISDQIKLTLKFEMPIPTSWSDKKKEQHLYQPHIIKPDIDNLIKSVMDYCNKILWEDDKQIYWLKSKKYYGPEPKTIIELE